MAWFGPLLSGSAQQQAAAGGGGTVGPLARGRLLRGGILIGGVLVRGWAWLTSGVLLMKGIWR
jgi:hypothetical protein